MRRWGWLFCLTLLARPASAIEIGMPVDCYAVDGCFIQNYADVIPGPSAQDYRCGPLTYDEHDGTDFRVRTLREMEHGIPVLAVADGLVMAIRDGRDNAYAATPDPNAQVGEEECGNGVLIDHGEGWHSQYCHLYAGSLTVQEGQVVAQGQTLGHIGLSGLTQFPHLHLALRHQGQSIDPFTGIPVPKKDRPSQGSHAPDCLASLDRSLWNEDARSQLGYVTTSIMTSGFATSAPDVQEVRQGKARVRQFGNDTNILIFWTEVAGIRNGDKAVMLITAPDGTVVASHEDVFDQHRAAQFRYIGLKRPASGWPYGEFTGTYRLLRGTETVVTVREKIRH